MPLSAQLRLLVSYYPLHFGRHLYLDPLVGWLHRTTLYHCGARASTSRQMRAQVSLAGRPLFRYARRATAGVRGWPVLGQSEYAPVVRLGLPQVAIEPAPP